MLKLVKTDGGTHGYPPDCHKCGSKSFSRSGIAWHCLECGTYYPTALGFETIKKHMEAAQRATKEFRRTLDDLERIVKE